MTKTTIHWLDSDGNEISSTVDMMSTSELVDWQRKRIQELESAIREHKAEIEYKDLGYTDIDEKLWSVLTEDKE